MDIKKISIIEYSLDEEYWSYKRPSYYYSGHSHLRSPYETDDSCGNCDGARCDTCKIVYDDTVFEFSIQCDKLYDMIKDNYPDLDEDIISELVYADSTSYKYKGCRLVWPSQDMLEYEYPEFWHKISATDNVVMEGVVNALTFIIEHNNMDNMSTWGAIEREVVDYYKSNIGKLDNHAKNQIDMIYCIYNAIEDKSDNKATLKDLQYRVLLRLGGA